jgi:ABC-type transport system involved in multi-copper enzyme maturation permease subunit
MGMIASERERGTAAFILTKPVARGAFVTAKLVALAVTLGLAMAGSGLASFACTAWLFEPPPVGGFVAMVVLVWLSQVAISAVTLLASVVAPSAVAAGAVGFAVYALPAIASGLPPVAPLTPAGLQNVAGEVALGSLPSSLALAVVANAAWVGAAWVLAWLGVRRQEV